MLPSFPVVVNGEVASTKALVADGSLKTFEIPVKLVKSSWVAVRILPSVHTNPVFVHGGGEPIRESERKEAKNAHQQAEAVYAKIAEESK